FELIDEGWYQGNIADAAYDFEKKVNAGRRIVVGVNDFTEGNEEDQIDLLKITREDEQRQIKNLQQIKVDRNQAAVDESLVALSRAAETDANLMLPLINSVKTRATVGEIMNTMAEVFGRYQEKPFI
ncbi:MAG TPA: methylmalonyl-CoA mutase, partial [Acidimicrobiaceae bacterium]|nr:methylmalonyl-CoA mutase [Acidimicrobiaceae bacterium]